MAETVAFKYRAFIPYSHADTSWVKWLHRAAKTAWQAKPKMEFGKTIPKPLTCIKAA